jgi:hypothetical protein
MIISGRADLMKLSCLLVSKGSLVRSKKTCGYVYLNGKYAISKILSVKSSLQKVSLQGKYNCGLV